MAHRVKVLVCPTCSTDPYHPRELDARTMFLKGNNAVLFCLLCGREFVVAAGLKCHHKGCTNPVADLICSKYTNITNPVACFCDKHKPSGFARFFWYGLLLGGQDSVPFIPDAIKGKCHGCGTPVICSNKHMFTRCPSCGKRYHKEAHIFGPNTLEPDDTQGEKTEAIPAEPASDVRSDHLSYDVVVTDEFRKSEEEEFKVIADELLKSEDEQFFVPCPHCGMKHLWSEERTRGNEKETLLQAILMMRKTEEVVQGLGMSNMIDRTHGWFCTKCGETIPPDYLLVCFSHRK